MWGTLGVEEDVPPLLPGWGTTWELPWHHLGRVLLGNQWDKGHFVLEKGMISQGSGSWCLGWLHQEVPGLLKHTLAGRALQ